jgi:hypothetical protein
VCVEEEKRCISPEMMWDAAECAVAVHSARIGHLVGD